MSTSSSSGTAATAAGGACERLQRALCECHRRIPGGFDQDTSCRRLNQALAQCLISEACPDESEAVHSMCRSSGMALKRKRFLYEVWNDYDWSGEFFSKRKPISDTMSLFNEEKYHVLPANPFGIQLCDE